MKQDRFIYLINQYVNKTISVEETRELKDMLTEMEQPELTEILGETWLTTVRPAFQEETDDKQKGTDDKWGETDDKDIRERIAGIVAVDKQEGSAAVVLPFAPEDVKRRVSIIRRAWFRYAAAVILILGLVTYFRLANRNLPRNTAPTANIPDVEPGRQTAMLTLGDGSSISLDSAGNGKLAIQGNAAITKLAGGQIVYQVNATGKRAALMNTMTTPRGGQYQLVLPDGTKVWLNAASAITYPVAFDGERKVKVKGEAYFEVAKNKESFIVDIEGRSSIEVLGTHFNVNAYADEENIRTTLVEGKIRVVDGAPEQHTKESVILKPGQQAVITAQVSNRQQPDKGNIAVFDNADLEQVLAWKNGLISLENVELPNLMRQLERWYDIQVEYEGAIPKIKFKGEMDRGVRLSGVLRFLTNFGIRTRMDGRTLIVLGN